MSNYSFEADPWVSDPWELLHWGDASTEQFIAHGQQALVVGGIYATYAAMQRENAHAIWQKNEAVLGMTPPQNTRNAVSHVLHAELPLLPTRVFVDGDSNERLVLGMVDTGTGKAMPESVMALRSFASVLLMTRTEVQQENGFNQQQMRFLSRYAGELSRRGLAVELPLPEIRLATDK